MIKKILVVVLLLAAIGVCTGIYLWNKPHARVEDAKGISNTAAGLAKEYASNEKEADAKYLNKAIAVSGAVAEVVQNQDGGLMVILDTGDPMTGIQCAMREKKVNISKGQSVVIKGFCSGNGITGVSLTDCIQQ